MILNTIKLPIHDCLNQLLDQLSISDHVVLQAPPGAGKTTHVPLAMLDQPWLCKNQKIIMLEPRRIAALNAARYMAHLLGEKVGETIGYRMRGATKVSAKTRIEVITEGLLTRLLQTDPELNGVAAIIFDEFHERSIHSDTGLALCMQANTLFRSTPLKLIVMSATLDGEKVSNLLNNAPIITSKGRCYPIKTHYLNKSVTLQSGKNIQRSAYAPLFDHHFLDITVRTICTALKDEQGSILVFLPGVREIQQVKNNLLEHLNKHTHCYILHGSLSIKDQEKAILPSPPNERKIVLTTDIAQTSLTIEGVRVVIDTGLTRSAQFDAKTGVTHLHTHTISQASAEQREGRAGRTETGSCYRLWTQSEHNQKPKQPSPEILTSDLTPLVLTLIEWGVDTPYDLDWLDPPPNGHWNQSLDILKKINAIDEKKFTTLIGKKLNVLPCHPRIARLLIAAKQYNVIPLGTLLAAVLSEKKPKGSSTDIEYMLSLLTGNTQYNKTIDNSKNTPHNIKTLVDQFSKILLSENFNTIQSKETKKPINIGFLLAFAYPDRIAKLKSRTQHHAIYQLANGRAARININESISQNEWIVAADLGGFSNQLEDNIYGAAALSKDVIESDLSWLLNKKVIAQWDDEKNKFIAKNKTYLQKIIFHSEKLKNIPKDKKETALLELVKTKGLNLFDVNNEVKQLIARVNLLHNELGEPWPSFSDEALLSCTRIWLQPHLEHVNKLSDFKKIQIKPLLLQLLPWPLPQELNILAPQKMDIPSGRQASIDYTQTPPVLAVKLQEMFGCKTTPKIIGQRINLSIHLLSPAKRPLQITQDLEAFWENSYHEVKKEMKGRYPKHPWPDDPYSCPATVLTKNRLDKS